MAHDPESEAGRMEALNDAVDRSHADNRHPTYVLAAYLRRDTGD